MLAFLSLSELFQRTPRLRRDTLRDKLLRLLRNVLPGSHLYVLLHKGVLMILKFILHSLGAASILRIIANLLSSNDSLDATFSDRRGRPLIINSCHILICRLIRTGNLLVLHLLPLLSLVAALLLHIHLHRIVIVRIVVIVIHEPIVTLNVSSRRCPSREYGSVTGSGTIAVISLIRATNSKVGVIYINSFQVLITLIIHHFLHIWWLLLWCLMEMKVINCLAFFIKAWILTLTIRVVESMIVITFVAWIVYHAILLPASPMRGLSTVLRFFGGAMKLALPRCKMLLLAECTAIRGDRSLVLLIFTFLLLPPLIGNIEHHLLFAAIWVSIIPAVSLVTHHFIIRLLLHALFHKHLLTSFRKNLPAPSTCNGHSVTLLRWFSVHMGYTILPLLSLIEHHRVKFCWRVDLRLLLVIHRGRLRSSNSPTCV